MSLKSWIKEFYPIPAHKVTKKNAIDACILKWRGLSKASLERHGMHQESYIIVGDTRADQWYANEKSCALCRFYLEDHCKLCPLAIVRKDTPCDMPMKNESLSPWYAYISLGDTKPMLLWLREAKKQEVKCGRTMQSL